MIAALSDWPLPAKVLASIMALLLAALLWSTVSSLVLLTYLGRAHAGWPLVEWWAYREWYPDPSKAPAVNALVERGLRLSALVSTGIPLAIGAGLFARHVAPRIAHDNARWASWRDLHKVGFSSQRGLYLARVRGRFVRLAGKQRKHMIVYAPTQSGKGVGTVIPSGLTADPMSLIFFDPKFEAFAATAGWQAEQGANVVLFAPLSPTGQTAQYNPCSYVRRMPDGSPSVDTWGDIEAVVHAQIPAGEGQQQFWNRTARTAYTAVLAFLSETEGGDFTIPAAVALLSRGDSPSHIATALNARRQAGRPYSKPCADNLREFTSGNADLLDGIKRTIKSYLGIFSNPRVVAATSGNTFRLDRLRHERTALYVGVAPNDIATLQPLLTLLFAQFIDLTARVPPGTDPEARLEVNMVLDEFPLLGASEKIVEAFGYIAGYGVRLIPIVQTPAQLEDIYKAAGARKIMDNCKVELCLAPDDIDLAEKISRRLGTIKGKRQGSSASAFGGFSDLFKGNVSSSATERRLMTAYEVTQLPEDKCIILHGGMPGALARRIRYYDQPPFKNRLRAPPAIAAIPVELRYDDADDGPEPVHSVQPPPSPPSSPPPSTAPKAKAKAKARPRKESAGLEMSVAQAEATLLAATRNTVDLAQFGQSPAAAKAQIDRVIHNLPTLKGRKL